MAAFSSILAVAAVASLGVSVYSGIQQKKEAKRANQLAEQSANEQQKANAVQSAQNAAQAAQEQRQQIREERVRRAQILQGAENAGTSGGSGAMGATGALSTNLTSNVGMNRSAINAGQMITGFNQSSANYSLQAQRANSKGAQWGQIGSIGMSLFNAAGGASSLAAGYNKLFGTGGSQPTLDSLLA